MPLIAIEEHWIHRDLTAALDALPPHVRDESLAFNQMGDHHGRLEDLGPGRIATMDAQGIDVSILALTPPGTQPLPAADATGLSRKLNDIAAEAAAQNPSRLRCMSTLPMSSPSDVAAELERAVSIGHVGTMVYGRSRDLLLDDPVYDEFFATAAALEQAVFIHPQLPSPAVRDASYRGFDPTTELALATFGWGWHLDAGLAALRLILRGTFDRHPTLQVVLGHWGEMLLFWLDRANSLSGIAGLERSVSDYLRTNFFITSSGMLNPALLQHALSATSIDRLIFSTDYPFQHPTRQDIDELLACFSSDSDREKFSSANATALFRLDRGQRTSDESKD
jgi:predicted TIM-barrel fold metal-dependent hydrolase